ncbi:nucleolar protein 6 [Toxorhynchites rutilus septentrionalis]|uniref:nucleolar protein 6 n=1 Tax=Toxorhynchites rutilus septentrionalis TaxID=329112 RepID=UPI00247A58D3|nr:nucleolar protein 6 [Toxorhynchites rutilus septentrionalis]
MEKFSTKIRQQKKPGKVHEEKHGYDSMIENGTDDDSDCDSMKQGRDSGNESGGRFVRAPPPNVSADRTKMGGSKRKIVAHDEAHQRKLKTLKQLYKPPTVEEINRLKETENYYHSNLFRLQVEEMLNEMKVKTKVTNFVDRWLGDFRNFLRTMKDGESKRSLTDGNYQGITFPLTFPNDAEFLAKENFKFVQQRIVHQIGSSRLGTSIGKPLAVDLVLEIPDGCLRKEDYLNLRYNFKRAHFLCHLAEGLMSQTKYALAEKMTFKPLKGNPLTPVLELIPKEEKFAKRVKFVIHAVPAEKFSPNRFVPEKNNVRPALIGKETPAEGDLCPTPHYNASIMYDVRLLKNQEILENTIKSDHIRQAIILLKVWFRQRNYDVGLHGFDGALVTFYVAYLLQNKKIYTTMSSYQIIRLFWNQLINSTWDTTGITLEPSATDSLSMYLKFHEVVFLDSSGMYNICAHLSGELYRLIKQEAAVAIQLLDNNKLNSFVPLFLNNYPVYTQYDHILSFEKPGLIPSVVETFGTDEDTLNYFNDPYSHFRKMVQKLLRRGLGPRASFIVPVQIKESAKLTVTFGILLNPQEAFATVGKGPEAIDKAASDEFRDFWRGKSELRRFKDGSITESCSWGTSTDPIGERRLICRKIVLFLLNAHYDIPETMVTYLAQQFEVSIKPLDRELKELHETVEERALACIRAFDELSKVLKNLDDLPLTINALMGTDALFRYSDPDPPSATAKALLVNDQLLFLASHVVNATIQLEASGKWPDQLEPIRMLKAALYLKIADAIKAYAGSTAELVPQACADYLDVLYAKYVFRFRIVHQREISILREYISSNKVTRLYRDSDQSIQLEMQATILPKLTSILHGLHQQYFSFGSVAAMAKRWLYSQLIDSFLWPDECTELIVAALYLRRVPTLQPQAGFLRFLHYLAKTDWNRELILLNFNDEIPDERVEELEKQFVENRDSFPPLAIVTSCDADKYGLFARRAPSQEVLNRVVFLARHVISLIEENMKNIRNRVHIFYQPSYTGYDLIIHLDTTIVPEIGITSLENLKQRKREVLFEAETKEPAAGFNPVLFYLAELRDCFRKIALFFYDPCGGDRIAVLWRPDTMEGMPFTTSNINGRVHAADNILKLNTEALVHDFEILGKGLVRRIETKP